MAPFKHLWIVGRHSGICVFEACMGQEDRRLDADLISGFFSALLSFFHEATRSDIKSITLANQNLLFSAAPTFIVAMAVESHADIKYCEEVLTAIQVDFQEKYGEKLVAAHKADIGQFTSFASSLEAITHEKARPEEHFSLLGKVFDIAAFQSKLKSSPNPLKAMMTTQLAELRAVIGPPNAKPREKKDTLPQDRQFSTKHIIAACILCVIIGFILGYIVGIF